MPSEPMMLSSSAAISFPTYECLRFLLFPTDDVYMSQPDLPARVKKGIPLTPYDRKTFYSIQNPKGYIDYPFADAEAEARYKLVSN